MAFIPEKFNGVVSRLFNLAETYTILLQSEDNTPVNGELPEIPVWTTYKTLTGMYSKSSGIRKNISDKYKSEVEAVIIIDGKDLTEAEILENSKVSITGVGDFSIVYPDDVSGQHIVLMLYVKEWK